LRQWVRLASAPAVAVLAVPGAWLSTAMSNIPPARAGRLDPHDDPALLKVTSCTLSTAEQPQRRLLYVTHTISQRPGVRCSWGLRSV